jgi:hypothetical protein
MRRTSAAALISVLVLAVVACQGTDEHGSPRAQRVVRGLPDGGARSVTDDRATDDDGSGVIVNGDHSSSAELPLDALVAAVARTRDEAPGWLASRLRRLCRP